jgi:hypothetical protein
MSANSPATRVLRPTPWLWSLAVIATLVFIAGFVSSYRQSGWTWVSLSFGGMVLIGCVAVVELATARVALSDDALEIRSLWLRRRYPVTDIVSVTWETGAGVSVRLSSGAWARVPVTRLQLSGSREHPACVVEALQGTSGVEAEQLGTSRAAQRGVAADGASCSLALAPAPQLNPGVGRALGTVRRHR